MASVDRATPPTPASCWPPASLLQRYSSKSNQHCHKPPLPPSLPEIRQHSP